MRVPSPAPRASWGGPAPPRPQPPPQHTGTGGGGEGLSRFSEVELTWRLDAVRCTEESSQVEAEEHCSQVRHIGIAYEDKSPRGTVKASL